MRFFSFISVIVLTSFMSLSVYAQDIRTMLDKVKSDAQGVFVTVEYSAEINGAEGSVTDSGIVEAQDDMWHLRGSFLEIYTDAEGTWILDNSEKEAYIEPAWSYDDLFTFYESAAASGSALTAKVLKTTISEKQPSSVFTPSLSSDWVVTDLR